MIDNFKDFNVEMVFKKGVLYWNNGELRDFEAPKIEEYLDKRAHDTFHVSTLTPDDFRDFTFANAVRLWGTQNPHFFDGTSIAKEAAAILNVAPARAAAE